MIRYISVFLLFMSMLCLVGNANAEQSNYNHPATDVYKGWRIGAQAYTFNRFSFFEAVDKVASLGLDWIEAYPGQQIRSDMPDAKMNYTMPEKHRQLVQEKLLDSGVRLVNYGVVRLPNEETECRKVFEFAKAMGIETIVSEPKEEALDLIDRLAQEYKINVALHNHPKPSIYWNPDKVLQIVKGRSERIGACADTGHWMRSGINPVEALKKLEGRIISLHIKDLNEFGVREAHDVPWGTGQANFDGILEELHRQNFKGVFSIEYEHNWENNVPEIRQCVAYFDKVAGKLNPSGWTDLFARDLSNAIFKEGAWTMEDGQLVWHGGSYIWSEKEYGNFVLDLEYKVSKGANSGVFLRTADLDNYVHTGIEVQIHETTDGTKYGMCGAIYDCLAPSKNVAKKAGHWNHFTITCKDNKINVVLNNEPIIDMDLSQWTEPGKNPDGTKNKFKTAYKNMPRKGHIGLQDHGQPVWFRNIKIKQL